MNCVSPSGHNSGMRGPAYEQPAERTRHRERGAVGVEHVGVLVIVAIVVGLVAGAFLGQSSTLGGHINAAICKIFTLGQGSCDFSAPEESAEPIEPCVVASDGYAVSGDISVTFVTLDGNVSTTIEQMSNGQYRVHVSEGRGAGVTAGIGGGWTLQVNDGVYGADLSAGASATVDGTTTTTYVVNSREAADAIRDWSIYDHTRSAVTPPGFGWTRWFTDKGAEWAGLQRPPEPDSRSFGAGASVDASANITYLVMGAEIEAAGGVVMGATEHSDGSMTIYGQMEGNVGIEGAVFQEGGDATLGGTVGYERTMDADGNLTSVTYTLTNLTEDGYREQRYTLPIETDADREVANTLLYDPRPWVWSEFSDAAMERGEATQVEYRTDGLTIGAGGTVSFAAEIGASGEFSLPTSDVTSAQYYDGNSWQPWTQCAG